MEVLIVTVKSGSKLKCRSAQPWLLHSTAARDLVDLSEMNDELVIDTGGKKVPYSKKALVRLIFRSQAA